MINVTEFVTCHLHIRYFSLYDINDIKKFHTSKIISTESQLNFNCYTRVFNLSVLMNIKRAPQRVRRDLARANTNAQIDARSSTYAYVRVHTHMDIQPVQQSDTTRRVGTGRGGTERDGECETRLCGQAERVLDCGSPLCPTHPPTAPRRYAPLAPAGSACRERERAEAEKRAPVWRDEYRVCMPGYGDERNLPGDP